MTEAPKVYCPKEDKKVPVWYCLGSYMQGRMPCYELEELKVDGDNATVKCNLDKDNILIKAYNKIIAFFKRLFSSGEKVEQKSSN